MAFESSQGMSFKFGTASYSATAISISESRGEIDTSTVTQASGYRSISTSDLVEYTFKVDWIGTMYPDTKKTAVLEITSHATEGLGLMHTATSGIATTATASVFKGTAICTGLSHTLAVGDVVKGSATFKVSFD